MTAHPSDVVTPEAWRTLRWTCTAVFMALLDATILFVAFPSIRRSFASVSAADLSWILNAYTVVYAALLVPAGRIADRIGRRRVFLQGVGLFTLGSLACGVAPTPLLIVAGRVVQAVGGAMLTPSSLALILSAFPRAKWPIAVSLWAAVGALAAAIGPSLGAAIVQLGGWRWAFFVNLPIGLVTLTGGGAALTESRDTTADDAVDVIGIGLLMAAVGLVALALVKGHDWTVARVLACYGVGTLLLGVFVSRARRVKTPALDLSLFNAASFRYANAATLVFGAAFSAMFLGSVLFLTTIWGYSTARAGLALTPGPLIVLIVAPLAGRVAARVGQRTLLVPGGALFGIGFLLRYLATSPAPHYLTEWLPAMVLTGVGVGLVLPSLASASAHSLPPQQFAVGSGVNQAIRQIGSVLGVSVVVVLAGTGRGADGLANFFVLFLFLALAGFVTALLSMAIDTRAAVTPASSAAV